MIVAFTSRRGGTGKTALSLACTNILSQRTNLKMILVDLDFNNDLRSLLKVKSHQNKSLDRLISSSGLDCNKKMIQENIESMDGFDILPGTGVKIQSFLVNKISRIANVIERLEEMYDIVVLDVNDALYGELLEEGFEFLTFNVLSQNSCNFDSYKKDIRENDFDGYYVLNRYRDSVFPSYTDLRREVFQHLLQVSYDENLPNLMNTFKCNQFHKIKSVAIDDIFNICDIVLQECKVISNTSIKERPSRKKSFLARLFGR